MDDQQQNGNDAGQNQDEGQTSDLDAVKKEAYDALIPIVDDLSMDADRKFDIAINAMRLTDDKALARICLKAALDMSNREEKAKALIELINEINYLQQS